MFSHDYNRYTVYLESENMTHSAFSRFPHLATGRLVLRKLTIMDAEAVKDIYGHPDVMRFYPESPYESITRAQQRVQFFMNEYRRRTLIWWGMQLKPPAPDPIVGMLGLYRVNLRQLTAETGFDLRRDCWGKGLMSEAVGAVLTFGFHELQLSHITATVVPGNTRSMQLLGRMGFHQTGKVEPYTLRNPYPVEVLHFTLQREQFDVIQR